MQHTHTILSIRNILTDCQKLCPHRGTWVVQWDEHPTLGFSSDCDLRVMRWMGSMLSMESAETLSPSPFAPPAHARSLTLSLSQINKSLKKKGRLSN